MSTDDRWDPADEDVRPGAPAANGEDLPALDLAGVQETDAWFERLARRTSDEADQQDDLTALFIDLTDEIDGSSASRATERLRATMGERPVWVLGAEEAGDTYQEPAAATDVFPRFAVGAVPHRPAPPSRPGVHTKVTRWGPVVAASAAAMVFFTSGVSVAMGNAPTLPMSKVGDAVSRLTNGSAPEASPATTVASALTDAQNATDANDPERARQALENARQGLTAFTAEQAAEYETKIRQLEAVVADLQSDPGATVTVTAPPTDQPTAGPSPEPTGSGPASPTATDQPTASPTGTGEPTPDETSTPTAPATSSPSPTNSALVGTVSPTETATP